MPESPLEQRPEPAVISDPAQADLELGSLDVGLGRRVGRATGGSRFLPQPDEETIRLIHSCTSTGSVVRGLRDGLAEHFTPRSLFGLSVTTHHSLGFTILVVRGTPETGLVNGNPSNRSPRGPATFRAFWAQFQATLPFVEQSPRLKVLLFHIDRVDRADWRGTLRPSAPTTRRGREVPLRRMAQAHLASRARPRRPRRTRPPA